MWQVDGRRGEGGGQVLRTSLTVAMLRGMPLTLQHIRAKRRRPGLGHQHLAAVRAAVAVTGGTVQGAALGSDALCFTPGAVVPGEHTVAVGTAGSTSLVLQTVLLPLLCAQAPSTLTITGGTHHKMAPSADALSHGFLPRLRELGAEVDFRCVRHGFYPAGGGCVVAQVRPSVLRPQHWLDVPPDPPRIEGEVLLSAVRRSIGRREQETVTRSLAEALPELPVQVPVVDLKDPVGPGNAVILRTPHHHVAVYGERRVTAEVVARRAAGQLVQRVKAGVPIGPHLADQLLLPLVVAGGGSFLTCAPSLHTQTNAALLEELWGASVAFEPVDAHRVRVVVTVPPGQRYGQPGTPG